MLFIRTVKCLKNQILGKIKVPGFPMLISHCARGIGRAEGGRGQNKFQSPFGHWYSKLNKMTFSGFGTV